MPNFQQQTQGSRVLLPRLIVCVLLLSTAMIGRPASAQITPNFVEAEIRSLIAAVGEATGKTFIVDPRVTGKVTLTSSVQMTSDEFYETFLSVLEVHDFVAQTSGGVIKIVPSNNARQMPGNDLPRSLTGAPDDIVTHVIKIRNIAAAQLVPILRPLVPQYGHLVAVPPSNMLIISDRLANVNRLVRIVNRIDQAGEDEIDVIPLEHASASELVRVITALNQGAAQAGGAGTPNPTVVADDRTNSILISGDSSSRLKLKTLVAHLDTPLEDGGDTQVIYLHYASAEDLAQRLNDQATATEQQQQGSTAGANRQSQTTIWADPETNALVITAPPKIMRNLRQVIDRLDIRRAQVQVEAIIAELSVEDSAALGVTWAIDGSDDTIGVGLTNFPGSGANVGNAIVGGLVGGDDGGVDFDLSGAIGGLTGAGVPGGVTAAFGRFSENGTSFAALLNALRSDGTTNILSTPTITTMDNQEATINVGQEVPFQTGSFTNTGGGNAGAVNPFQTIQREDVGINLRVTPRINESNSVILAIELESSSIAQGAAEATGAADLITNRRTITNNVIVEDGGIIVLGGLIDEQLLESDQRVPLLGNIPGLGLLFRNRTTDVDKRNLMVFIKPKILRDGMSTAIETNAKYNFIRDQQLINSQRGVGLMRNAERPVLPELTERQKQLATEQPESTTTDSTEQEDEQSDPDN